MPSRLRSVGLAALLALGCSRPPRGMLGRAWGDPPGACAAWQPSAPSSGFESCVAPSREVVLGRPASVTVTRSPRGVEGYAARFDACGGSARTDLRRAAREAFHLGDGGEVFTQWESGEVVRIEEQGDECTLVVAGPRLGPRYVAQGLALGLGGLFRVH